MPQLHPARQQALRKALDEVLELIDAFCQQPHEIEAFEQQLRERFNATGRQGMTAALQALDPQEYRLCDGRVLESMCAVVSLYDADGKCLLTRRFGWMPKKGWPEVKAWVKAELASIQQKRPDLLVVGCL